MEAPLLPALPGYDNPQLIAHGTTALVFRAVQTRLNRLVAIKVITADTGSMPVNPAREVATTVALSMQPHIVSIIDTGVTDDDRPFIVMEYCEGGSYAQILRSRGPLSVDDVLELGIKIGEALHAAHQAGIVHRDVKPSNILRSRFGPALTDFGIARASDELGSTLTREMMTPHHASPEALLHQAQSGLSDVYSLASTMWTLLIGHPPFVDPTRPPIDIYRFRDRVLHDPLPMMPREDVPAWLVTELTRAMAKQPAQRHASAWELAEALRRGTLGLDPAPRPAPTRPTTPIPGPGRAPLSGGAPLSEGAPRSGKAMPIPGALPTPGGLPTPVATPISRTPAIGTPLGSASASTHAAAGLPPPAAPASPPVTSPPPRPRGSSPPPGPPVTARSAPRQPATHPAAETEADGWLGAEPARSVPPRRNDWGTGAGSTAERIGPARRFDDQDLVDPHRLRRNRLVAILVALVVFAVAGSTVLLLNAQGDSPQRTAEPSLTPSPSATRFLTAASDGAPRDVRLNDRGSAVTITWTDPLPGKVPFIVTGRTAGGEPLGLRDLAPAITTVTYTGLDPAVNYCFVVTAIYSGAKVSPSGWTCTTRPTSTR